MLLPVLVGAVAAVIVVSLRSRARLHIPRLNQLTLPLPSCAQYLAYFDPIYSRKLAEYAPKPVPPEERLRIAVWIGPMYVIAFFWFG
jgi:hypothetical protein